MASTTTKPTKIESDDLENIATYLNNIDDNLGDLNNLLTMLVSILGSMPDKNDQRMTEIMGAMMRNFGSRTADTYSAKLVESVRKVVKQMDT